MGMIHRFIPLRSSLRPGKNRGRLAPCPLNRMCEGGLGPDGFGLRLGQELPDAGNYPRWSERFVNKTVNACFSCQPHQLLFAFRGDEQDGDMSANLLFSQEFGL